MELTYSFGSAQASASPSMVFTKENCSTPIVIRVSGLLEGRNYSIVLEPIDFRWNAAPLSIAKQDPYLSRDFFL